MSVLTFGKPLEKKFAGSGQTSITLLVKFWEPRSIRPNVIVCTAVRKEGQVIRDRTESLLPEITKRGILNLVERFVP